MERKLNVGIIGVGMVADRHIACFKEDGRVNVKWLCDKNETVLREKLQEHSIELGTTNYLDILNDKEVDAVVISTPPHTHSQIMIDTIKAGKHMLSEKPMCISKEDMDKVLKVAEEHRNLVLLDCSCRHTRLQPKYKFIKDMIDSGKLGEVYFIHHNHVSRQSRCGVEYHPAAKWFLNKQFAGAGPLMDWGGYDFSFHLGLLNDEPKLKSVKSISINGLDKVEHGAPVFDVEEHAVSLLEFDNGLRYYYERASNAHNEASHQTRIYGTKGGLKFSYYTWDTNEVEYYYVDEDGKGKAVTEKFSVDMSDHQGDEMELTKHFVDCLEGKAEPVMPLSLAAKHINIVLDIANGAETL